MGRIGSTGLPDACNPVLIKCHRRAVEVERGAFEQKLRRAAGIIADSRVIEVIRTAFDAKIGRCSGVVCDLCANLEFPVPFLSFDQFATEEKLLSSEAHAQYRSATAVVATNAKAAHSATTNLDNLEGLPPHSDFTNL